MNKGNSNISTIVVSSILALIFLGVGFFIGEKTAPKCSVSEHVEMEKELASLETENKELKKEFVKIKKEEVDKDEEKNKSNIFTYSPDLPAGGSCTVYDNDMDNFLASKCRWGGATTLIPEVMYNYNIYEVESYDNGTLINMDSTNSETGNYDFKVFFDRDKDKYFVLSVKDKDNGKTYKSPDSIWTYLNDVYQRILGI